MGMCENINYFFWAGGYPCFKRSSTEILTKSYMCLYFKLWVVIIFLNELGYHMPCEFLDGAWETEIHSRARGSCHVSTSPSRGVTNI